MSAIESGLLKFMRVGQAGDKGENDQMAKVRVRDNKHKQTYVSETSVSEGKYNDVLCQHKIDLY
jgi:hypothetical protein